ncbi:hypothetical protein VP01_155g4 [Puccinia sorghi]|uniref:DUF7872 domain-containing protein n=1 Tax=Puccinia sorghi TaxID=27349 RepID=A0A0L6VJV8_9BASI|nr:hypothetical protein VP01_155g4 [Puccinia sorghi]
MVASSSWRPLALMSLVSTWASLSVQKHEIPSINNTGIPTADPLDIEHNPCRKVPLTQDLWSQLGMNTYLENYPRGSQMSLQDYASEVGATDFSVGIGEHPHAGQLCETVQGRDWYALVAVQNWNSFVNTLYESAAYAFGIISGIIPEMAAMVGLVTTWVTSFPGCIFSSWAPLADAMFDSIGEIAWASFSGTMYVSTAFAYINAVIFVGPGEERFQRGANVAEMMAQAQRAVQSTISNITQNVLNSPINHPEGLAGINRDGSLLNQIPTNFQSKLQRELERALKLKSLAKFWRVQNAFIVRGSDPCIYEGVNGAFADDKRISYCGDDNIMMNIVRGEKGGKGYEPTIHHASLVERKYGYSAKFLTSLAWECQRKHGGYEYDWATTRNRTASHSSSQLRELALAADCYFNLPVCDLTRPESKDHSSPKTNQGAGRVKFF